MPGAISLAFLGSFIASGLGQFNCFLVEQFIEGFLNTAADQFL